MITITETIETYYLNKKRWNDAHRATIAIVSRSPIVSAVSSETPRELKRYFQSDTTKTGTIDTMARHETMSHRTKYLGRTVVPSYLSHHRVTLPIHFLSERGCTTSWQLLVRQVFHRIVSARPRTRPSFRASLVSIIRKSRTRNDSEHTQNLFRHEHDTKRSSCHD